MNDLIPTPIVDKNGIATTRNKKAMDAHPAGSARVSGVPIPRQLDIPQVGYLDAAPTPDGWTKHMDDGPEGPYMEGPSGEILRPNGNGSWNAVSYEGVDEGDFDTFEEALEVLNDGY